MYSGLREIMVFNRAFVDCPKACGRLPSSDMPLIQGHDSSKISEVHLKGPCSQVY